MNDYDELTDDYEWYVAEVEYQGSVSGNTSAISAVIFLFLLALAVMTAFCLWGLLILNALFG